VEILSITGIAITENGEGRKDACFEMTVPDGCYRFTGYGSEVSVTAVLKMLNVCRFYLVKRR
jgi:hypothetical protein